MYSSNKTPDKFTAIAKIGGTCITITIWCIVGVWIYRQTTKQTETQPQPQPVETVNDSAEIPTKLSAKSDLDIESFKPQLNESTWGEVEDIINSFKAEMRQCESYEDENKTACYDHYKTQFWRKMDSEVKTRN
ncbi:MAG: hypothetical protein KA714_30515 [Limnoraphis sp. WC205]|jgi:hypothetical protein|nr:hypothetical protein [Limnoraphis sp. WC205]